MHRLDSSRPECGNVRAAPSSAAGCQASSTRTNRLRSGAAWCEYHVALTSMPRTGGTSSLAESESNPDASSEHLSADAQILSSLAAPYPWIHPRRHEEIRSRSGRPDDINAHAFSNAQNRLLLPAASSSSHSRSSLRFHTDSSLRSSSALRRMRKSSFVTGWSRRSNSALVPERESPLHERRAFPF